MNKSDKYGKCRKNYGRSKKKESVLLEWLIWIKDHDHHEQFTSVFFLLFRIYVMVKTSHALLNA